jgi:ribose/xylose/arabinose/galactoside ABC-type transport system permease subunit
VVLMTMLRPVLTFLDIGAEGEKWTGAIQGVFIIAAVVGDHLLTRFRSRSRQGNIDANPTELEGEPS